MVELKSIFKTMPEIREEIEYGQIRLKLKEYLIGIILIEIKYQPQ